MLIAKEIRTDIQNSEALKDKINQLNGKVKEGLNQSIQQERTINTMKVTNKSLEQRLTQAHTKIEELNSVKGENEAMKKKFNSLNKNLEDAKIEIEGHKKYQQEMQKKFEEAQKKAAEGAQALQNQSQEGSSHQETLALFRQNRGHNQQSRQSRTQQYFHEMAKTSWLGGRKIDSSMTPMAGRTASGANSAELQKMLYA
jgi:predicted  nucleic acid-binding Zn-ribbon protein